VDEVQKPPEKVYLRLTTKKNPSNIPMPRNEYLGYGGSVSEERRQQLASQPFSWDHICPEPDVFNIYFLVPDGSVQEITSTLQGYGEVCQIPREEWVALLNQIPIP
jgi:hypothetical protein